MDSISAILTALQALESDSTTPRNVKVKVVSAMKLLAENCELSIKKSKVLCELEELSADSNMQADVRTQLFNIVSLLERV